MSFPDSEFDDTKEELEPEKDLRFSSRPRFRSDRDIEIECKIKKDTGKAVLLSFQTSDGKTLEKWCPLSQISKITRRKEAGDMDTVTMTRWIAGKIGIGEEE